MKLTILGSAAAEGIPALFCHCEVCRHARAQGGPDIRRRTSYLWDEDILIDLGPDLFFAQVSFNLDYAKLHHLLMTHSHADHFLPESLQYRHPGFSILPADCWLTVYGNARIERRVRKICTGDLSKYFFDCQRARVGEEIDLDAGRSAVPVAAAHAEGEECLNYILKADGKTILVGNDSGWWQEETWQMLAAYEFDVAIIDCTYGRNDSCEGHLGVPGLLATRNELRKVGALASDSRVIANHFSHNGQATHDELIELLRPEGVEGGYDGMQIEL